MTDRQRQWQYRGKPLEDTDIPEWATGFVYRVIREASEPEAAIPVWKLAYIGKKQLTSTTRKKIGIREKTATKTRKTFKKTTKSSGWESYWSSCKELVEAVKKEPERYEKHIIEWCFSKKNATYLELKYQFLYNVLEYDTFNANINGSIYKHDTDMQLYEEFLQRKRDAPKKSRQNKQICN